MQPDTIKLSEFIIHTPFNLHVLMDNGDVILIDPYNIPRDILTTSKPLLRPISSLLEPNMINGVLTNALCILDLEYYRDFPYELEQDLLYNNLDNNSYQKLVEAKFDVDNLIGRGLAESIYNHKIL